MKKLKFDTLIDALVGTISAEHYSLDTTSCALKCHGIILTGGVEKPTPAIAMMMMAVMMMMMMMMISWADAAVNITAARDQLRDEWYNLKYKLQYLRPDERYYFNQVRHSCLFYTTDN